MRAPPAARGLRVLVLRLLRFGFSSVACSSLELEGSSEGLLSSVASTSTGFSFAVGFSAGSSMSSFCWAFSSLAGFFSCLVSEVASEVDFASLG